MNILFYAHGENPDAWLSAITQMFPAADCRLWTTELEPGWQADYALVWRPPTEFFHQQHQLKAVINLGAGVDQLLSLASRPADVPLLKLRNAGMADWMLDYIRYGLLHFRRDFDRYRQQQTDKYWHAHPIDSKSRWPVGILGAGAIGAEIALQLRDEGYPVQCWSRTDKQLEGVESFAGLSQLDAFLAASRVLINILPATPETTRLIGAAELGLLPDQAVVISCGRGEVFDQQALAGALVQGELRGALLDVFQQEPLPQPSAFWGLPNVIVTPHIAAPTPVDQAVAQVRDYIENIENGREVAAVDTQLGY